MDDQSDLSQWASLFVKLKLKLKFILIRLMFLH